MYVANRRFRQGRKPAVSTGSQTCGFDRHKRFFHDCQSRGTVGSESCKRGIHLHTCKLDAVLNAWRERLLDIFPFVQCDAIWVKVRQNGLVKDAAFLVASGVDDTGKRSLLGISVSTSESEIHWRSFFESLVARGLRGVRLITSDTDKTCFVLTMQEWERHGELFKKMPLRAFLCFGGISWQAGETRFTELSVSSSAKCSSLCSEREFEERGCDKDSFDSEKCPEGIFLIHCP